VLKPQPMVVVRDVEAASHWFQEVLGLTSGHGGDEYEMLLDGDDLVLQLHRWEADEHPVMGNPDDPSRGNGILLWFSTDDVDAVVERARSATADVIDGPLDNPNSHLREIWLRHPDGHVVVVAGP
jgi:catechol 2,3-dioxygenase-like lactoylglutathione lyase family enzyme